MKILITGATGFIGTNLLEYLRAVQKDIEIRIIKRSEKVVRFNLPLIEVCRGDLSDISSIKDAFEGIDIVINLAAELKDKEKFEQTNIQGVKNIIDLSVKNKIKKIIHLSSVGVVGAQYSLKKTVINESSECFPKNEYERTKLESERLLLEAVKNNKFKLIILRPTNVIGDGHPRNYLLNFIKYLNKRKLCFCLKSSMVNYVYVEDVTAVIIFFLSHDSPNTIYNIGSSSKLSDFVTTVSGILSVKPRLIILPFFCIRMLVFVNYFGIIKVKEKFNSVTNAVEYDDLKLRQLLRYNYGIEEGLKRTIEYYKEMKSL